jgi:chromosome segregation ATPase
MDMMMLILIIKQIYITIFIIERPKKIYFLLDDIDFNDKILKLLKIDHLPKCNNTDSIGKIELRKDQIKRIKKIYKDDFKNFNYLEDDCIIYNEYLKEPNDKESNLNDKESNINDKESNLNDKESNLNDKESNLNDKESNLNDKESNLNDKESNLNDKESNLNDKESNINDKESNLNDKESK